MNDFLGSPRSSRPRATTKPRGSRRSQELWSFGGWYNRAMPSNAQRDPTADPAHQGANGPLDGLKVVDLSRVLAGPYLAMMLGDMGAEVVKIEQPGAGDDTRRWGP